MKTPVRSIRVPVLPQTGGIVKRSLAMALLEYCATIAKACGLDDATRHHPSCERVPAGPRIV